jgi:hypothetical protein
MDRSLPDEKRLFGLHDSRRRSGNSIVCGEDPVATICRHFPNDDGPNAADGVTRASTYFRDYYI